MLESQPKLPKPELRHQDMSTAGPVGHNVSLKTASELSQLTLIGGNDEVALLAFMRACCATEGRILAEVLADGSVDVEASVDANG